MRRSPQYLNLRDPRSLAKASRVLRDHLAIAEDEPQETEAPLSTQWGARPYPLLTIPVIVTSSTTAWTAAALPYTQIVAPNTVPSSTAAGDYEVLGFYLVNPSGGANLHGQVDLFISSTSAVYSQDNYVGGAPTQGNLAVVYVALDRARAMSAGNGIYAAYQVNLNSGNTIGIKVMCRPKDEF